MLRSAVVIDLVIVLHLNSKIKIDEVQTKVVVDKKVVGLEVPVSNTVLVKIREAQVDLR